MRLSSTRKARTFENTRSARRSGVRTFRPRVEPLEDRLVPAQFLVTPTLDDGSTGSLRWAADQANATAGPDEIVFSTTGEINLIGGQLDIRDDLIVYGPGAGVLAVGPKLNFSLSRVFHVASGANAIISGLTIERGRSTDGIGGDILNDGTLTLRDCALVNNGHSEGGSSGGAIYNAGNLTVRHSYFTGNFARG